MELDIDFFFENGYSVINNVVSKNNCMRINSDVKKFAENVYYNRLNLHRYIKSVAALIRNKNILSIVDTIQNHRMIPVGSTYYFCQPRNKLDKGSVIHQDNERHKATYGSLLVCKVALDDSDESNGSLRVFPTTHKLGDIKAKPSPNFVYDKDQNIVDTYPVGAEVEVPNGYQEKVLNYRKGDLILLHGHIIHYAKKNMSTRRWRRGIYLHYIKDGEPFWPGWTARRMLFERDEAQLSEN